MKDTHARSTGNLQQCSTGPKAPKTQLMAAADGNLTSLAELALAQLCPPDPAAQLLGTAGPPPSLLSPTGRLGGDKA